MRDRDVRGCVWRWLEAKHADDPDTLMLDELGIFSGASRIDIAVINGQIEGFELKSEKDTLERLPAQSRLYNRVFDRVSLVVAERHLSHAAEIVPEWWGLAVASEERGNIALSHVRITGENPVPDPEAIAGLLWRDEALALLEKHGATKGVRSKPKDVLYARLAATLDLQELKDEVRRALKIREGWRSDRRLLQCDGSPQ